MRPSLLNSGGVGLVVEGAGDQDVEVGVAGLAGGGDEIGAGDGAELRADEDGGALLGVAFHVAAFGADQIAGPGRERVKAILSSLWACWTPAVLRFSRIIWTKSLLPLCWSFASRLIRRFHRRRARGGARGFRP